MIQANHSLNSCNRRQIKQDEKRWRVSWFLLSAILFLLTNCLTATAANQTEEHHQNTPLDMQSRSADTEKMAGGEISASQLRTLYDKNAILIDAYPFDTKLDTLQLPSHLKIDHPTGYGLHLIQFTGPIKDKWLRIIEATGSKLIHYVPNNAYLIWTDDNGRNQLDGFIAKGTLLQFSSPYQPYFKLGPSLIGRVSSLQKMDEKVAVTIQMYNHEGKGVTESLVQS